MAIQISGNVHFEGGDHEPAMWPQPKPSKLVKKGMVAFQKELTTLGDVFGNMVEASDKMGNAAENFAEKIQDMNFTEHTLQAKTIPLPYDLDPKPIIELDKDIAHQHYNLNYKHPETIVSFPISYEVMQNYETDKDAFKGEVILELTTYLHDQVTAAVNKFVVEYFDKKN